jgi:hypothetical protein
MYHGKEQDVKKVRGHNSCAPDNMILTFGRCDLKEYGEGQLRQLYGQD